jgi:hypothetical protein
MLSQRQASYKLEHMEEVHQDLLDSSTRRRDISSHFLFNTQSGNSVY